MTVTNTELAWLAGFWDGEGSIGLNRSDARSWRLNAQLSHTDLPTVVRVLDLLTRMGITRRGYTYQERDPEKHRDAHYIRVTNMTNIHRLATALLPYAVTKRAHWELAVAWAERRIALSGGLDAKGNVRRGGLERGLSYQTPDQEVFDRFAALNRRGPASRVTPPEGKIQ